MSGPRSGGGYYLYIYSNTPLSFPHAGAHSAGLLGQEGAAAGEHNRSSETLSLRTLPSPGSSFEKLAEGLTAGAFYLSAF